jgi:hypothetical protein
LSINGSKTFSGTKYKVKKKFLAVHQDPKSDRIWIQENKQRTGCSLVLRAGKIWREQNSIEYFKTKKFKAGFTTPQKTWIKQFNTCYLMVHFVERLDCAIQAFFCGLHHESLLIFFLKIEMSMDVNTVCTSPELLPETLL